MHHLLCTIAFVLSLSLPLLVQGYGEPNSHGRPTYQGRASHLVTNFVRVDPTGYKAKYMVGFTENGIVPDQTGIFSQYPRVPPLYLDSDLAESSYAHSADMASKNCFQHPSCDGTAFDTRVAGYYTCSSFVGENIAAGNIDPINTNNQYTCDLVGNACAGDNSGKDGHRENIMLADYKVMGSGYATGGTYNYYWTTDFGDKFCSPTSETNPIYAGSHLYAQNNYRFYAVFYEAPAATPSAAKVVIDGTSHDLTLDLGVQGQGSYMFATQLTNGCHSYYFTFTSSSGSHRYPDTGCLLTYSDACTDSYSSSCTSTTGSGTPAPTPKPTPKSTPKPTPKPTTSGTPAPTPKPTPTTSSSTHSPTSVPTRPPTNTTAGSIDADKSGANSVAYGLSLLVVAFFAILLM